MNHFNPGKIDVSGKREIASHYYPLIGPYDSSDPDALEYHVLLMKLAGIDGIIVDWYGSEDFWDYGIINQNTSSVFEFVKKAGLEFAICYEDQTIEKMVDNNHIKSAEAIQYAQQAMQYLQINWFADAHYLKLNSRPVLLSFGWPLSGDKLLKDHWNGVFRVVSPQPQFFTENYCLKPVAAGAFAWPPMSKSKNGILSQESLNSYLVEY